MLLKTEKSYNNCWENYTNYSLNSKSKFKPFKAEDDDKKDDTLIDKDLLKNKNNSTKVKSISKIIIKPDGTRVLITTSTLSNGTVSCKSINLGKTNSYDKTENRNDEIDASQENDSSNNQNGDISSETSPVSNNISQ